MNKLDCEKINIAINNISALRDGFYLSNFLIQPHVFHITFIKSDDVPVTEHSHTTFEISLILEGKISYQINGCELTLSPGDVVIIPPGLKHLWVSREEHTVVFGYMCFISCKGMQPRRQRNLLLNALENHNYHIHKFSQYDNCIKNMIELFSLKSVFMKEEVRNLQMLSYIHLFKMLLPKWKDSEKPVNNFSGASDNEKFIEQVRYYIHDNISRSITLSELNKHFGLSKDYINRLFKKEKGVTIGQYITELRIGNAIERLITTNHSIKTIAIKTGFVDLNYFCYIFKKHTGKTPGEYRRINRKK